MIMPELNKLQDVSISASTANFHKTYDIKSKIDNRIFDRISCVISRTNNLSSSKTISPFQKQNMSA